MQTLPNGIQKVESTDVVTVASINRNDDLLDGVVGVVDAATDAATPNTLVKRTSDGRIKAAPAVDDNDVVTKESVDQIIGEHNEVVTTINQGGNVLDVKVAAPLDITVYGDTAFNILGDMGAMNILNRWQTNGVVPIVDTARSNTGETSFKFSPTASSDSYVYQDMRYPLEKTKSYLVSAMVYIESRTAGDVTIGVYDSGSFTIRYSKNADVSKVGMWQYVALKIPKTNAITTPSFRILMGCIGVGEMVVNIDSVQVRELYDEDFAKPTAELENLYPYVSALRGVHSPAIRRVGKNVVPPFSEWTAKADNATPVEPYKLVLNATLASQRSGTAIDVVSGQKYTFKQSEAPSAQTYYILRNTNASGTILASTSSSATVTITAPTSGVVWISTENSAAGTFTYDRPILSLGETAAPFEPRNDDYVYIKGYAFGNRQSGVRDALYQRDGEWKKLRNFDYVPLDGRHAWELANITIPGMKIVRFAAPDYVPGYQVGANLNGYPFGQGTQSWTTADQILLDPNGSFYISVLNADSGWVDGISPNQKAAKAFMNGWKATSNNGTSYTTWATWLTGVPAPIQSEDYVSANKATGWGEWGNAILQRKDPIEEPVAYEGAVSLYEGKNAVFVDTAVIVREPAKPMISPYNAQIVALNDNGSGLESTRLGYRAATMIVYKGLDVDPGWIIVQDSSAYGLVRATIPTSKYDANASYFVTYKVLDDFVYSLPAIPSRVRYAGNIGTAFSEVTQKVSDLERAVSVHDNFLNEDGAYIENTRRDLDQHIQTQASTTQYGHTKLNNSTNSAATNEAATAAAVKAAYDQASRVRVEALTVGTDLNTVVTAGFYRLQDQTHPNMPNGNCAYGQMLVIRGGADTVTQLVFAHQDVGLTFIRGGNPPQAGGSGQYSAWTPIMTAKGGTFTGRITANAGVGLPNNDSVYGTDTNGQQRTLIHINPGNSVLVGDTRNSTGLLSSAVPTWWNGSVMRELMHNGGGQTVEGTTAFNAIQMSGNFRVAPSTGGINNVTSGAKLEVNAATADDAYISFHIASSYAVNFGLRKSDSRLHVGGWSLGEGNTYRVWDERDFKVGTTAPANPMVGAVWIDTNP